MHTLAQHAGAYKRSINKWVNISQIHPPSTKNQMTSGLGTTAKYSDSESAKKANVMIPIENKCTHFSFSLFVLVPGDWLPN